MQDTPKQRGKIRPFARLLIGLGAAVYLFLLYISVVGAQAISEFYFNNYVREPLPWEYIASIVVASYFLLVSATGRWLLFPGRSA